MNWNFSFIRFFPHLSINFYYNHQCVRIVSKSQWEDAFGEFKNWWVGTRFKRRQHNEDYAYIVYVQVCRHRNEQLMAISAPLKCNLRRLMANQYENIARLLFLCIFAVCWSRFASIYDGRWICFSFWCNRHFWYAKTIDMRVRLQ